MHKRIYFVLALFILACSNPKDYSKAEDAQEAGTQFIRASLDGDYAKARFFLLKDSTNLLLIKQQQINYEQLSSETKRINREASIRPIEIKNESDSVTLYKYYQTSNTKDTTTIRIVRDKGEWLVDLKSILKM